MARRQRVEQHPENHSLKRFFIERRIFADALQFDGFRFLLDVLGYLVLPGVELVENVVPGFGRIDDVVFERDVAGVAQVGRGDLEGVEQVSGFFGVEIARDDQAHDLHDGDLDGMGVLEDRQCEGELSLGAINGDGWPMRTRFLREGELYSMISIKILTLGVYSRRRAGDLNPIALGRRFWFIRPVAAPAAYPPP